MTRFDWLSARSDRAASQDVAPRVLHARLDYLAEAAGAAAATPHDSAVHALAMLRDACIDSDRPRRVVGCGGDDPALVQALSALAARRGDTLVLTPANPSGAPAAESLWLATERRAGEPPPFVVLGATTQTGLGGALPDLLDLQEARTIDAVVDLTPAPWTVLDELDAFRPLGVVAALDRWDGRPPGTWASLVLPAEPADEDGGLPPEPPEELPAALLEIDAWLRGVLQTRASFRVWPRGGAAVSPGVIALEIEGQSAAEAALLLERSFGVLVDAGPLTAAPLPPPVGFSGQPIRLALHPEHDERSVEPLIQGLLRLAEAPALTPTLH